VPLLVLSSGLAGCEHRVVDERAGSPAAVMTMPLGRRWPASRLLPLRGDSNL